MLGKELLGVVIKSKVILSNMLWKFAERGGSQIVSFVVSIILARLLAPEEFGVISLITVLTNILDIFVDSGFSNALIQKQEVGQKEYSSVFFFNIGLGTVFYAGMYGLAPVIADFYGRSYMIPYIRVLSITLIIGGFNVVQRSLVAKRLEYRKFFYSSLGGTLLSAVIGIAMALSGFGVWALIARNLIDKFIDTAILWFTVRWRPSLYFSLKKLKPLASYGIKLMGSGFLYSGTNNLMSLVIGKVFSASALAYYEKGRQIPNLMVGNVYSVVQEVLFPVMAEQQKNKESVCKILRQSLAISAYCIFPCLIGIAACAKPITIVLFTEKWLDMVPFLQLWCLFFITYLVDSANLQVIQSLGRSDIFLKLEIIKEILTVVSILVTLPFGVLPMLALSVLERPIHWYINAAPCKKLIGYGFVEEVKELKSIILLNGLMGVTVWCVGFLPLETIPLLIVQVMTGVIVYLTGSVILRVETLKTIIKKKKTLLCI